MQFMGYNTCLADPDICIRRITRSSDGFKHYEYVLLYVDYFLTISDGPTEVLQKIDKYFGLKPGSLFDLNIYLGEKLDLTGIDIVVVVWYLILLQYIQYTVRNMEGYVKGILLVVHLIYPLSKT